jgi:hypothetical protein
MSALGRLATSPIGQKQAIKHDAQFAWKQPFAIN